jgi:hypothetical protein
MRTLAIVLCLACAAVPGAGGAVSFSVKPSAASTDGKVRIAFAVSGPSDVEVAVLAADGNVFMTTEKEP